MKDFGVLISLRLVSIGCAALFLLACTNVQPTITFTSMDGLGLLGPKPITSSSLETKGYITIGGQCSSLVQRLEVSALLNTGSTSSWYPLNPQEVPISGESTPSADGVTFDQDCADGTFLVYIFRHSLNSWFAAGSTAGKDNITALYIRGILSDGSIMAGQTLAIESCGVNATQYTGEFFCHALCGAGQRWRPVSGRNFLEILQNDFLFLFSKLHTSQVLVVESCLLFQV